MPPSVSEGTKMKNKLRTMLAAASVVAAAGTTVLVGSGAAFANNGVPWDGCPDGYVCIYAEGVHDNINASNITNEYYRYGTYNLSNQVNWHWILNNQNGAYVKLCTGYNGTGDCSDVQGPGHGEWRDLTPINSIVLYQ
jgi:hypothetical protein